MSFSSNIKALQELVNFLPDRDEQLKRDAELFNKFFKNFPIPVTMWSLDKDKKLLSKKGNAVIKDSCTGCHDMFLEKYSDEFKRQHELAYAGNVVSFFSFLDNEKTYYTKIIPWNSDGDVTGVTGISWDITNNYQMLVSLQKIIEVCGENSEAGKLAAEAITKSRIPFKDKKDV